MNNMSFRTAKIVCMPKSGEAKGCFLILPLTSVCVLIIAQYIIGIVQKIMRMLIFLHKYSVWEGGIKQKKGKS